MKSTENGWDEIELYHDLQQAGLIPVHGDFFPAVHYPPITRYAPLTEEEAYAGFQLPENNTFDIYVHIPFCLKRCIFCHYPSKYNAPDEEKDRYLEALKGEMNLFLQRIGANRIRTRAILIGGGTPTDLTPKQLEYFLQYFTERSPVRDQVQFNYDVDPNSLIGPVGLERLKLLKDYGVTPGLIWYGIAKRFGVAVSPEGLPGIARSFWGVTWYPGEHWGVGLNTGLWLIPEFNYNDALKKDNALAGFVPITVSVTYRQ